MNHARAPLVIGADVRSALDDGRPIVAMESTVYSSLGLPAPFNRETFDRCEQAIVAGGATPALTAVIDGQPHVGVDDPSAIFEAEQKVAARDLAVAATRRWPIGVTTVGASLTLAHRAGIDVFATGGIGGVHRGAHLSGDISGDVPIVANLPLVTVCAGAKSFLDLARTLELLETLGVPVLGFGTDELPAFTTLSSGLDVPYRSDDPGEIAEILKHRQALGQGGVLVCVPPPEPIDPAVLAAATDEAEERADAESVTGPKRTPFILAALAEITGGATVAANTALVANNAAVATQIAAALTVR